MAPHTARMTPFRRWLRATACALLFAVPPVAVQAQAQAPSQAPSPEVKYTRQMKFWIPFEPEGAVQRLRQVELYYSTDQGRVWRHVQTVAPNERGFQFYAERDGHFAFAVRTVDVDGRAYPAATDSLVPGLVVCVDTQPPVVRLSPFTHQDGVGVEWDVRDDNLDLSKLRLEGRAAGATSWQTLQTEPDARGRWIRQGGAAGLDEVRLQVLDRAGNLGESQTSLSGRRIDQRTYPPGAGAAAGPAGPPVRLVNSNRISINYKVEDKGASGVTLELWWTRDSGRTWEKYPQPVPEMPPCIVPAPEEGLYGFTLVARSGVNLGDAPPRSGDTPQVWVEVDLKSPKVDLTSVEVGRGQDANKMTLRWQASDRNLDERPIRLEYAMEVAGPWQEIAAQLPAQGSHVWVVPSDGVRYYVRAVARDKANNIGTAQTPKPIVVDLSRPRGIILEVQPVRPDGPAGQLPDAGNSITLPRGGLR